MVLGLLHTLLLLVLWSAGVDGGFTSVADTAALRSALEGAPADGVVELTLTAGTNYALGGYGLVVPAGAKATLQSEGVGATIDAEGLSRNFDVSGGGTLSLDRVHLANGVATESGGCVLVRSGSSFTATHSRIENCDAASTTGNVRGGAIAAATPSELVELYGWPGQLAQPGAQGSAVSWAPVGAASTTNGDIAVTTTGANGAIRIYDKNLVLKDTSSVGVWKSIAWNHDGTRLAAGSTDGKVAVFDPADLTQTLAEATTQTHLTHTSIRAVNAVIWNPSGTRIVSGGADGTVTTWSFDEGTDTLSSLSAAQKCTTVACNTSTSLSDCVCMAGFVETTDSSGVRQCECAPGREHVRDGGTEYCQECKLGYYKTALANSACTKCPYSDDGST